MKRILGDQKPGFEEVTTNWLSPFPCLIEWACGGHYVYNPTLKRFFVFHFLLHQDPSWTGFKTSRLVKLCSNLSWIYCILFFFISLLRSVLDHTAVTAKQSIILSYFNNKYHCKIKETKDKIIIPNAVCDNW